jgi:dienelactone hydrolase
VPHDCTQMMPPTPAASARRFRPGEILAAVAVLSFAGGISWLLRDPTPRMLERRSAVAEVHEGPAVQVDSHLVQVIRLQATSGLTVDLTVKRHMADTGARPLAMILGGHRTGQDAVRLLENTRGVVAAAVSYPYRGDPRPYAMQIIRDVPHIRSAFVDTPPALMLALDYLLRRPDVDSARVEGIGVSLGAPFVVIAGALDPRIRRVWVVHGSGGSFVPLQHNMRETVPFAPLRYVAAAVANTIIAGPRLAPERWVGRTAGQEFVMINAAGDERMPAAAVRSLFAAAAEPKQMIWMPGGHVRSVTEAVRPLVDTVMTRIAAGPASN